MVDDIVINDQDVKIVQRELKKWYQEYGRTFPWRNKSASNYILIIAEVFLQRTKAETISKYLPKFIKKYPNWKKLGEATEIELQEVTRPIGLFKQRGTRLYKLAQELKKRKGRFPKNRQEVEKIPMMGQYITNAYELYVLKKNSPLLDVNMARLLERIFGERKLSDIRYDTYLQTLAYKVVDTDNSIELNWAILDFASLVCRKNKPKCDTCSLTSRCNYFNTKKT